MNKNRYKLFVAAYLKTLNATQAAIDAGYSKKTAYAKGSQLLKVVEVKKLIDAGLLRQQNRIEISADRTMMEIVRLAMIDARALFEDDGRLKNIKDLPEDISRCIASVEVTEISSLVEGGKPLGYTKKIKFWDKTKALDMLAKHFKLITDRLEVALAPSGPYADMPLAELAKLAAKSQAIDVKTIAHKPEDKK